MDLTIAEWALSLDADLAEPVVPMYGTPADAVPLVTNGALGVDLIRIRAGGSFDPHTHPGDHLLIVVQGEGTITMNGAIRRTRAGVVYLVPGAVPHAVGALTDHSILAVGAPHRRADDPDRQALTDYEAIAADLGSLTCEVCGTTGTVAELVAHGCGHAPRPKLRDEPIFVPHHVTGDYLPGGAEAQFCDVRLDVGGVIAEHANTAHGAVILAEGRLLYTAVVARLADNHEYYRGLDPAVRAVDGALVIPVPDRDTMGAGESDRLERQCIFELARQLAMVGPLYRGRWEEVDAERFSPAVERMVKRLSR